jgi:VanZ family protein
MYGLFIEFIHFFHPYRFFEYLDLLANLIGVTIALLIFELKNNKSY